MACLLISKGTPLLLIGSTGIDSDACSRTIHKVGSGHMLTDGEKVDNSIKAECALSSVKDQHQKQKPYSTVGCLEYLSSRSLDEEWRQLTS